MSFKFLLVPSMQKTTATVAREAKKDGAPIVLSDTEEEGRNKRNDFRAYFVRIFMWK